MKKVVIIVVFLFIGLNIQGENIVNIWADNSSLYLGLSKDRVWLKSYFLSNFQYYSTLKTETKKGIPTIVTASRDLYFLLDSLLKNDNYYKKDSFSISREDKIYTFIDDSNQLEISFGLEKPTKEIFNIINMVYENDPKTRKIVTDHYLESWVIRIFSAENVISPDINSLDFDDILISATIIGEKSQWLWGVHDGVDYIYSSLK
ncbi:hypothetical protein EW093_13845 [Thiospirochaeta perfilievii]|uniref:Uncharacterized protein n=1 Tax=Thiospirochaeta perfilievii TaxID=252967 RepID=A0A5C1QF52_9SPIO|nr:hypothetical protein [Thiospirochaeta perfilievii]QEN05740.1 hypothetical protein EW093_13845 [Thiospirochaeta perfilievii]